MSVATSDNIFQSMGIYKLQTFIKNNCDNSIHLEQLKSLSGKKVAIDVTSLMYKYKKENDLLYKIFMFCTIFRNLNIHMCMIFDGIPSVEKLEAIKQRKLQKQQAYQQMKDLQEKIQNGIVQLDHNVYKSLQYYHNQSVYLTKEEINSVKQLLTLYGISWIVSNGEADFVCGYLARNGFVDAVISDDTDMFVLGCPIVVRFVSLIQSTCVIYNLQKILYKLGLSFDEFHYLCSISKSDYNVEVCTPTFEQHYRNFKTGKDKIQHSQEIVYSKELQNAKEYLQNHIPKIRIQNIQFDEERLHSFLKEYKFYG